MRFELDKDERARFDAWDKQHVIKHHGDKEPYCGAIGGRVSFVITNTSMGQILGAQCGVCLQKGKPREDFHVTLTDFSDW
jgi:hypothetical protein